MSTSDDFDRWEEEMGNNWEETAMEIADVAGAVFLRTFSMMSEPVYTTGGGRRFHWYANCPTLAEWQDKARQEGKTSWPIKEVSLWQADKEGRTECRTCRAHRRFQEIDETAA